MTTPRRCGVGALVLAMALLGGCAGSGGGYLNGDAPLPRRLDPATIHDAVPRVEPIRAAGNKSPYTVLGHTYRVLPTARGYRARGVASWYGRKFHGRHTANGEIYDAYAMTGAHRTLPIPSYVRVTNLANGKSAIVRINDRGPFHDNRLIDLSWAAATKLGFVDKGTTTVEVVAIDPHHTAAADRSNHPAVARSNAGSGKGGDAASADGHPYLQAGAFIEYPSAEALRRKLAALVNQPVQVSAVAEGKQTFYRVRIGPLRDRAEADDLISRLLSHDLVAQLVYR